MEKSTFKRLKTGLSRKLRDTGLDVQIGQGYAYKGNSVQIIPIQFNDWWYGTIQIQRHHLRARLSKVDYTSHMHVSRLDTLNTDDVDTLIKMVSDYIHENVI